VLGYALYNPGANGSGIILRDELMRRYALTRDFIEEIRDKAMHSSDADLAYACLELCKGWDAMRLANEKLQAEFDKWRKA